MSIQNKQYLQTLNQNIKGERVLEGFVNRSDLDEQFPFATFKYTADGVADGLHWHRYLQVGVCLSGVGKFFFSNKVYDVEEGDVFITNNFESHVAVANPGEKTEYLFVIFLPEVIAFPGCRQFELEYLYPFRYNAATFEHKIPRSTDVAKETKVVAEKLHSFWSEKKEGYEHDIDGYLRLLLSMLSRYYKELNDNSEDFDPSMQNKIFDAVHYINANYLKKITLEEVSAEIFMSKSRFRHLFKESMNMGFKDYVTYLRLAEAKKLLQMSDMNISDISVHCGFSNLNQFYKVFSRCVNVMPAEYRKNFKKISSHEG